MKESCAKSIAPWPRLLIQILILIVGHGIELTLQWDRTRQWLPS